MNTRADILCGHVIKPGITGFSLICAQLFSLPPPPRQVKNINNSQELDPFKYLSDMYIWTSAESFKSTIPISDKMELGITHKI